MGLLIPIIIVIEVITAVITSSPSKQRLTVSSTSYSPSVLGQSNTNQFLAQEETPTPIPDQSQDTPTPALQDATVPTPEPTSADTPTPALQDATVPTPEPTSANEGVSPEASPAETTTPSESPALQVSPEASPAETTISPELSPSEVATPEIQNSENQNNIQENLNEFSNTLQNNESTIFKDISNTESSDTISQKTKEETQNENQEFEQAQTPDEKANLLVKFGNNDVSDINSYTKENNSNEVDFHVAKLDSHLNRIGQILEEQPAQTAAIKQEVSELCQNAEPVLRTEALIVPDDTEQTIDIVRGKCFNYVQQ